ncbi:primase C-terminal domain-containing protein, partial [Photobacterium phosphoreum]
SYKTIREYWQPNYKRSWNEAVYAEVESLNSQFTVPLPVSEVKAIAKSIANWTYRHFTPEKFRESQAIKGRKGGLIGGKRGSIEDKAKAGALGGIKGGRVSKGGGRPDKKELLPKVMELKALGYNNRSIADDLGLSAGTISNWIRNI